MISMKARPIAEFPGAPPYALKDANGMWSIHNVAGRQISASCHSATKAWASAYYLATRRA